MSIRDYNIEQMARSAISIVLLIIAGANCHAQEQVTLRRVEIVGLKRLNAQQVLDLSGLKVGDIVLFRKAGGFKAHRILQKKGEAFITRGDAGMHTDGEVSRGQIVGRVVSKQCVRTGQEISVSSVAARMRFFLAEVLAEFKRAAIAKTRTDCAQHAMLLRPPRTPAAPRR